MIYLIKIDIQNKMENNTCQVSLEASRLVSSTQGKKPGRKDVNGVDLRIPGMIIQDGLDIGKH